LEEARLLVVQRHRTPDGKRAYERYHIRRSGRFTDAETTKFGEVVVLSHAKSEPDAKPTVDPQDGPKPTYGMDQFRPRSRPKTEQGDGLARDIKENQLEGKAEAKVEQIKQKITEQTNARDEPNDYIESCAYCGRFTCNSAECVDYTGSDDYEDYGDHDSTSDEVYSYLLADLSAEIGRR
jgi:hypothetical protein